MKNTVFKLLPYGVGALLGWLLFSPPDFLHDLGLLAYLVMALFVAALFLTFLGFMMLASFPAHLEVEPAVPASIPPDMQSLIEQWKAVGFVPAGPLLSVGLSPKALLLPLVHAAEPIYASVFRTGVVPAKLSYDCVSVFDGEGGLTTGPETAGAVIPSSPRSFRQVFPGSPPAALLEKHRRTLAFLAQQGIRARPATAAGFVEDLRAAMVRGRRTLLRRPVFTVAVTAWRILTHTTPHVGLVEEQAVARKQLCEAVSAGPR